MILTSNNEDRARLTALCVTVAIALAVFVWLRLACVHLAEMPAEWPPRHDGEVVLAEDRFFEVIEVPMPFEAADNPSPVHNDEVANNASDPAPTSGHDLRDAGKAADAPTTVTSNQPSPVKAKTEKPKPSGPSQAELEAQREEEARRKANAAMNSAFNNASGNNNTANAGSQPGNSGSPSGTATGINGTGTGSVGGGWYLPSYAKVPSTVTGSIRLMVKINQEGKVTAVTFQGGDAPAATDARLRQAVENEVRSRRFTRGNTPAPDQATAYITYRFR